MAQMNLSNTLWNDDSSGTIALVEQLKDRLLHTYIANNPNYSTTDKNRIPAELKTEVGVFQEKLNEFFLDHWVDFQRFLLDEGVDPETIDSWKEVQEFLEGLPDDETMWLKNKLAALDTAIAGIDQDGIGIFDVSAYNNIGGTYATYNGLSTALAAIPTASKRSGMTIRYIDSTSNQYKEYKYFLQYEDTTAGNAAFNNTANWQGIDDEPTANSDNLVKSGGIYEKVSQLDQKVTNMRIKFLTYTTDAPTTRALVPQSERLKGMILSYYITGTGWIIEQNKYNYDQQGDANWLPDNQWIRVATLSDISDVITLLNNLDSKIGIVNKDTCDKQFFKSTKVISASEAIIGASYNKTTGLPNFVAYSYNKARFNPIPVSHTAIYKYTGKVRLSSEPGIIYTNENFTVISSEIEGTGSSVQHTDVVLTVPYNAKFILANCDGIDDNFKVTITDFEDKFESKTDSLKLNGKLVDVPYIWLDNPSSNQYNRLSVSGSISIGSSVSYVSDYISIDQGKTYYLNTRIDQYRVGLVFYDTNDQWVGTPHLWDLQESSTIVSGFFIPPKEATKVRICSTTKSVVQFGYMQDALFVKEHQGIANAGKLIEIDNNGNIIPSSKSIEDFVKTNQGISEAGKFLKVGSDGMVALGDGSQSPIDVTNCVQNKVNKTIFLGDDVLSETIGTGSGWSHSNGSYTHSSGSTEPLVFALSTTENQSYIVSFTTNTGNFGELNILVSIGDKYFCDPYNGTTGPFYIGIKSDGGYLKITPSSAFTGTISNVTLKPIVSEEASTTSIIVSQDNVESNTMTSDITSWWNVVIGATNALKKSENSSRNIAIGHNSLSNLENGERNIGIGTFSLLNLKYGHCNVCIGADTLYTNYRADYNVAIGKAAMCYMHADMSIPYYSKNTAVGQGAMSGRGQTFTENVAIGSGAMSGENPAASSSRINNVAIGANAGANAKVSNVVIGYQAGFYADTGNVTVGYRSGYYNKGNYNVFLGYSTGETYVNNNNCIFIGKGAKAATGSQSASNIITIDNSIVIGTDVVSDKSNQILIGNSTQTELIIMGKKIKFNNDNTVTWESIS